MVSITMLWLPILLSAIVVFVASSILWMALPFWHRKDYGTLPDEKSVMDGVLLAKSGQYVFPYGQNQMTPEQRAAAQKGPMGFLILRNPGTFSFPTALVSYFAFNLVVSVFIGYVTGVALPAGAHYLQVFRIAGTAAILGYSFGSIPDAIWYGRPWSATVKNVIDGVICGLLVAGVFGWLWPR